MHGGTGYLKLGGVMLLASRGGKTAERLPILDICRKKGVTLIEVTGYQNEQFALIHHGGAVGARLNGTDGKR